GVVLGEADVHLGAGAAAGLHDEAVLVAVDLAEALVDVAEAHAARAGALLGVTGEDAAQAFRVHADAVVLDADVAFGAGVLGDDRDVADAVLALQAVPYRVLHEGLQAQERQGDREHLGGDAQGDLELVAEAG